MTDPREARLAAMRARRSTPEFAAAGAELLEQKRAERAAREAADRQRIEDFWRHAADVLPIDTIQKHRDALDAMLADVAFDQGCSVTDLDDGRALEVCDAYVGQLPVNRRSAAIAVDLYRTFSLSANETLDRLARS